MGRGRAKPETIRRGIQQKVGTTIVGEFRWGTIACQNRGSDPLNRYWPSNDNFVPIRSQNINGQLAGLARFSHQVSQRGGADGHGFKTRDRGLIRRSRQYVEEPAGVQRNRHARVRRRGKSLVRNAG